MRRERAATRRGSVAWAESRRRDDSRSRSPWHLSIGLKAGTRLAPAQPTNQRRSAGGDLLTFVFLGAPAWNRTDLRAWNLFYARGAYVGRFKLVPVVWAIRQSSRSEQQAGQGRRRVIGTKVPVVLLNHGDAGPAELGDSEQIKAVRDQVGDHAVADGVRSHVGR